MSRISFSYHLKSIVSFFFPQKHWQINAYSESEGGNYVVAGLKQFWKACSHLSLLARTTVCCGMGAENNAAGVSPKRGVRGLETQEHSRVLFNSMSSVSWAGKMRLKDESFPGQGFTLQPDLRNYLGPRNRDFSTQNKVCTVSVPQ